MNDDRWGTALLTTKIVLAFGLVVLTVWASVVGAVVAGCVTEAVSKVPFYGLIVGIVTFLGMSHGTMHYVNRLTCWMLGDPPSEEEEKDGVED